MNVYRDDVVTVIDPDHVEIEFADGENSAYFDNDVTEVRIVDTNDD
jgi:hypothetical protein